MKYQNVIKQVIFQFIVAAFFVTTGYAQDMWPSDDNWDRYESGSQSGCRLKGGLTVMLDENIGVDLSYA